MQDRFYTHVNHKSVKMEYRYFSARVIKVELWRGYPRGVGNGEKGMGNGVRIYS